LLYELILKLQDEMNMKRGDEFWKIARRILA
jgi:hypothetical protein